MCSRPDNPQVAYPPAAQDHPTSSFFSSSFFFFFCFVVVVLLLFCVHSTQALWASYRFRFPQSTIVRCYRSVNVYHVEGVRHWANRTDMSPPGTCMTHDPNNLWPWHHAHVSQSIPRVSRLHREFHLSTQFNMAVRAKACEIVTMGGGAYSSARNLPCCWGRTQATHRRYGHCSWRPSPTHNPHSPLNTS